MTDAGWAEKKVREQIDRPGEMLVVGMISLLKAEHARSVRIAKRAERMELRTVLDTDTNEYLAGYQHAVSDILAALQRGRGGKG